MSEMYNHETRSSRLITVVLKVDLSCNCIGCTREVLKCIRSIEGVVNAKGDFANNKITVIGKVDPDNLCKELELKSKKVRHIFSQPNMNEEYDRTITWEMKNQKVNPQPENKEKKKRVSISIEKINWNTKFMVEATVDDLCEIFKKFRVPIFLFIVYYLFLRK